MCEEVKVSDPSVAAKVGKVQGIISQEASRRISAATEVISTILRAGSPGLMLLECAKQCRQVSG